MPITNYEHLLLTVTSHMRLFVHNGNDRISFSIRSLFVKIDYFVYTIYKRYYRGCRGPMRLYGIPITYLKPVFFKFSL